MGVKDKLRRFGEHPRSLRLVAAGARVRSVSALTAGIVREVADVALPIGFRRGRLYRSLVDVTLQFLIEDVGGVQAAQPNDQKLGEDFLLRRAAGNGIELMGVIAFRASPVWVLAALADVAGFGRQLIPEIAESLEKEGLLAPDGSFATMEQFLGGLERSSGQLAESVNAPPLDVRACARSGASSRPKAAVAGAETAVRQRRHEHLAGGARDGQRERRSVFEVSSLLAVSAVSELPERARVLSKSAAVVLRPGGAAVSNALLDHYRQSLQEIREVGFLRYGVRQLTPYTHAAIGAFLPRARR